MAESTQKTEMPTLVPKVDGETLEGNGTESLKIGDMAASNRLAEGLTYQQLIDNKNAQQPENPEERVVETAQAQFGGTTRGEINTKQSNESSTQVAPQPKNTSA